MPPCGAHEHPTALSRSRDRRLAERRAEAPETEYHERQRPRRTGGAPRLAPLGRSPSTCANPTRRRAAASATCRSRAPPTSPPCRPWATRSLSSPCPRGRAPCGQGPGGRARGRGEGAQIYVSPLTEIDLLRPGCAIAEWFDLAGRSRAFASLRQRRPVHVHAARHRHPAPFAPAARAARRPPGRRAAPRSPRPGPPRAYRRARPPRSRRRPRRW